MLPGDRNSNEQADGRAEGTATLINNPRERLASTPIGDDLNKRTVRRSVGSPASLSSLSALPSRPEERSVSCLPYERRTRLDMPQGTAPSKSSTQLGPRHRLQSPHWSGEPRPPKSTPSPYDPFVDLADPASSSAPGERDSRPSSQDRLGGQPTESARHTSPESKSSSRRRSNIDTAGPSSNSEQPHGDMASSIESDGDVPRSASPPEDKQGYRIESGLRRRRRNILFPFRRHCKRRVEGGSEPQQAERELPFVGPLSERQGPHSSCPGDGIFARSFAQVGNSPSARYRPPHERTVLNERSVSALLARQKATPATRSRSTDPAPPSVSEPPQDPNGTPRPLPHPRAHTSVRPAPTRASIPAPPENDPILSFLRRLSPATSSPTQPFVFKGPREV